MCKEITCKCCGTLFCRISNRGRPLSFCTHECRHTYHDARPERVEKRRVREAQKSEKAQQRNAHQHCANCGDIFSHNRKKKYCSPKCRDEHRRRKAGVRPMEEVLAEIRIPEAECKVCGVWFKPKGRDRTGHYCSRECAYADYKAWHVHSVNVCMLPEYSKVKPCAECGGLHGGRGAFCSEACAEASKVEERVCRQCGTSYHRAPGWDGSPVLFCSSRCKEASARDSRRAQRKKYGNKYRHRARRYGVRYEPVNVMRVFERDGWRCQICGKDTPKARRGTRYSNAPELDHRIPLSVGGPHSYDNVQCACKACNHTKSNRSEVGQLPLLSV